MDAVWTVFPALGAGVDCQRLRLLGTTAAEQTHRQPIEPCEMIEVGMREQHFIDNVNPVGFLEFQERWHHAHPAVDQRMPHDLPVLPLDQRIGDVRLAVRITDSAFF